MYEAEILGAAVAMLGSEPESLSAFCTAAEAELTYRLRPGVSPSDCKDPFITAAAFLALSYFESASAAGGVSGFKVGDISVTKRTGDRTAVTGRELRNQAEIIMMPYIGDGGFGFMGVRG